MKKFVTKHKNILLSVGINVLFCVLLYVVCGVKYELSDDWYLSRNIADGNADYVFCNYFIQLISLFLQKLIYPINAFIVLQIVLNLISMTVICFCLLETFSVKKGLLFSFLIECIFALNAYSLVSFTKTAAILAIGGGLLMLWAHHNNKHIGYSIFGIVLIVFGSFYRFKIFYSVLAVFCFCIFALIAARLKKPFCRSILSITKEIVTVKTVSLVLSVLALVFGLQYVSSAIIYSGEGMDYYKKYNPARSAVLDYEIPFYDDYVDEYEKIGFSKNDFYMLQGWYLDDEGYLSLDTLYDLQQMQAEYNGNIDTLKYIKNMAYREVLKIFGFAPEGILMTSYLVIAAVMLAIYKKKNGIYVGVITVGIGLLYLYLWLGGRINYRAVFSIWFTAVVCLIYMTQFLEYREWILKAKTHNSTKTRKRLASVCILCSLVFLCVTTTIQFPKLAINNNDEYKRFEEYVTSSDKTFALSCISYGSVRSATVLDNPLYIGTDEVFDKCLFFGSAYYAHPSYDEFLAKYDVKNLYKDIVDSENILFVDRNDTNHIDLIVAYLNEQYGENKIYSYEFVDAADEFNFYKIVSSVK